MELPKSMGLTLVSLDAKLHTKKSNVRTNFEFTDNEDKDQTGYVALVKALRTQFATDKTKQYYISAAPQCPLPDASIPVGAMQLMDFVVSSSSPLFPDPYLDLSCDCLIQYLILKMHY